jgi:hypothetical protein
VTAQGGNGGGGGIVQDCGGDSADLSADPRRIEETIRCSGEAGAFFVRLKDNVEGIVLSETQEGIAAFVQGQLDAGASLGDILSNVVDTFGEEAADEVLRSLEDPSPAGIAAALFRSLFGGIKLTNLVNTGGGGGGGSGGGLNLAAGLGVLRDAGGRTSVRPGDGGFGGVTIVDDLNSNLFHFVYRSTRPAEAFGGSRVVSDGTDDAGVAVFDHSTIQTGVTDRTLLRDVRVHALGIADRSTDPVTLHPIKITVTCETTGAFTNAIVARGAGDRMAITTFFLCPGFNQLAAEISVEPSSEPVTSMHALLQKRILVVAVDSDGDGLGDRDEAVLGTDPLRQDSDADGLPDGDEVLRGTDPVRADSDGDGLGDGDEVARGTNPLGSDTDGDGVSDGVEVLLGTDPRSAASRATALPTGTLLAGSNDALAIVDASTGFAGLLSQLPVAGFGLAFDAAGRLHVALGGRLAWHDPLAGTTTDVGAFGGGIEVVRLAFDPIDALLYGVEPSGQLVRIDPVTGAAARVGVPGPDPVHALAFDRTGALFAAVAGGGGSDRLVQLDPATGAIVTELGPIGFAPVLGLAFDRAGALLGIHLVSSAASQLLVIDPATGLGAASVPIARPLSGLTIAPCPAPCFAPPASHAAGGGLPMSIAVVDMNGDGLLDVVTANASTVDVSVLLGNGDGTFQAARRFPAGGSFSQLSGLAVGDLDGDGFPDVVTGDRPTQRVVVFLNDGAGGLGPATPFPVGGLGNTLNAMAIGDLTGDGIPDVAAGQFFTEGSVSVLAGDGAGGFAPPVATPAFRFGIRALAIGDVDGDGLPDVATGHADGTVVLLYGDGAGGFPRSLVTRPVDAASALDIADATGDGRLDIVATGFEGSRLAVLPSNGLAGLGPAISLSVGPGAHNPVGVAVGDLTGDGVADLVTANFRSASISVLVGDGRLGFRSGLQSPYPVAPGGASGVALGDLNGDGLIDVVVADPTGTVIVLTNQSPF